MYYLNTTSISSGLYLCLIIAILWHKPNNKAYAFCWTARHTVKMWHFIYVYTCMYKHTHRPTRTLLNLLTSQFAADTNPTMQKHPNKPEQNLV